MRKMFSFSLMCHRTRRCPRLPCDTLYKDGKCSGLKPSSFKQDQYKVAETINYPLKAEHLHTIAVSEYRLLQGKLKAWTSAKDEPSQGTWLGSPFQSLDGGQGNLLYAYGKAYKLNVFWRWPPESSVSVLSLGSTLALPEGLQQAAQGEGHS